MKKYFLYAVILFLGLTGFSAQSVGEDVPDFSAKYWSSVSTDLDKDPEKKGKEVFAKRFREMLALWPDHMAQIGVMKNGLNEFLARKDQNVCKATANAMLEELKKVVGSNKQDDIVRINALIMIGELNSSYSPVIPYSEARAFLKDQLKSENPAFQIAALSGLALHVNPKNPRNLKEPDAPKKPELGSSEKDDLAKEFAKYAFAPLVKGEAIGSPETQWMRIISLEALGNLGLAGPKSEYASKLLESATTETKTPESPYYRRDMERRIMAALAFSKLRISAENLKEMNKKPEDLTKIMTKLFITFMCYEYNTDFNFQESLNGDEMGDPMMRRQYSVQNMTPEEEAYQIRLWKQRTKAISLAFNWIFNDKESNLVKLQGSDSGFKSIASQINSITIMYDRAGLPKKKPSSKSGDPDNPEPMVEDYSSRSSDKNISLYSMQRNMWTALTDLGEEAKIPVKIEKKKRQTERGY